MKCCIIDREKRNSGENETRCYLRKKNVKCVRGELIQRKQAEMSSVHAVSFNRQYGSFRTTNAGIPKSPVIGGLNRGLIATISSTAQPNRVMTRSQAASSTTSSSGMAGGVQSSVSSVKNQENLPNTRVLAVTPRSCRKALTSNGSLTTTANGGGSSTTKKIGLNSPLQSPQIIRSTRIEQNNWNKKLTTSNFCSLHSKSPGSSGTSVESIVPKYTNSVSSNNGALKASFPAFGTRGSGPDSLNTSSNGSQKRAYNVNKPIAKGATKSCIGSSNSCSSSNSSSSSSSCANSSSRSNNGCVSHKIVTKKLYRESNAPSGYVAQMASALSNGLNTNTVTSTIKTSTHSSSSSSSSYSSKFPNGLPFENEFYRQPRRSISEVCPAEFSRQSQRRSNSSDTVSLSAYGDEFSRKPSNEDLFVDFTKSLPETPKVRPGRCSPLLPPLPKPATAATSSIVEYRNINHSNYFYKFESISGGAGRHLRRQRRPSRPRLLEDSRNNNQGGTGQDPVEPMAVTSGPDRCGGNGNEHTSGIEDVVDDDEEGGEEMEGERSTVYVAVATWVPKCNRLPYQQQESQHDTLNKAAAANVGPTSDNSE